MNDNLNNFFTQLQKYKDKSKKLCINCKRNVGTQFSKESWDSKRVYKIQCGDSENPCDLNETFTIKQDKYDSEKLMSLKQNLSETHVQILQIKNKLIHEIISEEIYKESFKKLEDKYKSIMMDISTMQKGISLLDNEYRNKSNELKNMIDENKKIEQTHLRINHYLKNIHNLKDDVAQFNKYEQEKNIFQLQKKLVI